MFFPADVAVRQLERNICRWAGVDRAQELEADIQERHEGRGCEALVPELVDDIRQFVLNQVGLSYQQMVTVAIRSWALVPCTL
ncbi:hypothetical protein WJX74_010512 [Apatococcus lobatus]|uniref:Uncharacterized protein n=1 Tax=Apatococcus lobatus TaxID=904363 RepID=A0AAW1RZG5_9CHLO